MNFIDAVDQLLAVADQYPDGVAIDHGADKTTYAAFAGRVRAIAHCLSSCPEPRVAIALPQTSDAYAAMFAAGLAGGFYTPLNIDAPLDKLNRIIGQLQPHFIIAGKPLATELAQLCPGARTIDPQDLDADHTFAGTGTRHRLAYVTFTSGSTGTPKGVMISRAALAAYIRWMKTAFAIGSDDRVSQQPNLAFDLSVNDIYGALCHGGQLCPPHGEADRLMPARMIARERITVWNSVPSVISLMDQAMQVTPELLQSVRLFNFCGEALLPWQVEKLFAACPDAIVRNTYGPTEATVAVTDLPMTQDNWRQFAKGSIAIGQPFGNTGVHLVGGTHPDEGELAITGDQLADGYWHDPERTSAAFRMLESPHGPQQAYFTGDWMERVDGELYFRERIDFQVKIKGYRIELDDVATAIRDCGWPVCCVFKHGEALAAVVETSEPNTFDEAGLIAAVRTRLDSYAVPSAIAAIARMPRNQNDKIDRMAAAAWFKETRS